MYMKLNEIIILGSGTSTGVPTLGCKCSVCTSNKTKNKRLRSSILLKTSEAKHIIIDTTPDLRTQLLNNSIDYIDAAIITHEHADHTHGIDDLRPFCFYHRPQIPVYTSDECAKLLEVKFPYIFKRDEFFKNKKILGGGIPRLDLVRVGLQETIENLDFTFFELPHGHTNTIGFYVDKFAYIVDCASIPKKIIEFLKNQELELLIIDCLRTKPHDTHLNLEQSLSYIEKINPKMARLTHLSHEFEHDEFSNKLRRESMLNILPLFDGQRIMVNLDGQQHA